MSSATKKTQIRSRLEIKPEPLDYTYCSHLTKLQAIVNSMLQNPHPGHLKKVFGEVILLKSEKH